MMLWIFVLWGYSDQLGINPNTESIPVCIGMCVVLLVTFFIERFLERRIDKMEERKDGSSVKITLVTTVVLALLPFAFVFCYATPTIYDRYNAIASERMSQLSAPAFEAVEAVNTSPSRRTT